jgi:hypothetical protein
MLHPMRPIHDIGGQPVIRAGLRQRVFEDTVLSWYETAGVASVIGLVLAAAVLIVW